MFLLFLIRLAESSPVWESLLIRFTVRVLHGRLSICECDSFLFGFEGGMWDLIVLVPDHCFIFYFLHSAYSKADLAKEAYLLILYYSDSAALFEIPRSFSDLGLSHQGLFSCFQTAPRKLKIEMGVCLRIFFKLLPCRLLPICIFLFRL